MMDEFHSWMMNSKWNVLFLWLIIKILYIWSSWINYELSSLTHILVWFEHFSNMPQNIHILKMNEYSPIIITQVMSYCSTLVDSAHECWIINLTLVWWFNIWVFNFEKKSTLKNKVIVTYFYLKTIELF
jgi:hypothetical protein